MKNLKSIKTALLFLGIVLIASSCKKEENENGNEFVAKPKAFTVASEKQVYFAKGNLQFQASTSTWRFAPKQWEIIGYDNTNVSETYDGWIDLFCWGTSGNNHGAVCYQPWSVSSNNQDYYAYGVDSLNLYDRTGAADWGYNTISNAENPSTKWRTLTTDEWKYVFYYRETESGIRYAKAVVNEVNGMILLPDDWNAANYNLTNHNLYNEPFTSNEITKEDWENVFETNGAVFLPMAGYRYSSGYGEYTYNVYSSKYGLYWSSSKGKIVLFNNDMFYANYSYYITPSRASSVRLASNAE